MFTSLDVSTSGLVAQRARLNAISSNIANMSTTRNELGEPEPYKPRYVTFETDTSLATPGGGNGVKIGSVEQSDAPPEMKYEPGHPDADERGYVRYPAVNMTMEFVNAMEAMAGSAGERRLGVRTRTAEDGIEIAVGDSGPGIPSENLGKIFDSFFTTKNEGTGLGLAMTRSIVEAHGGTIAAQNLKQGGACVRIALRVEASA